MTAKQPGVVGTAIAKANKKARTNREDWLINKIITLNEFLNKIILAHKDRIWKEELRRATSQEYDWYNGTWKKVDKDD